MIDLTSPFYYDDDPVPLRESVDLAGNPFADRVENSGADQATNLLSNSILALAWEVRALRDEVRKVVVGGGFDE